MNHKFQSSVIIKITIFMLLLAVLDWGIGSILEKGMRRYFGMDRKVDILCVGHSRTVLGIDAQLLERQTGLKVAKYAVNGANIVDRDAMIRQFLHEHPEVRLIIYDVEASTFSHDGLSSNSYQLFWPFMSNPQIRAYIKTQCPSESEFLVKSIIKTSRYNEVTFFMALRGLMGMNRNLKYGRFDEQRAKRWIEKGKNRLVRIDRQSLKVFLSTMDYVNTQNVKILLIDMPNAELLNKKEYPESLKVKEIFKNLCAYYRTLLYLDLSTTYENNYDLFYDPIHLNAKGQKTITNAIVQYISDWRNWDCPSSTGCCSN